MNARMLVSVECEPGAQGEAVPRVFTLGGRRITIREILDWWPGRDHRYFKVRGQDEGTYILRHDRVSDTWEMILFEREEPA